jgi:site-specific DNA-methyltransferase (adenine-specific)
MPRPLYDQDGIKLYHAEALATLAELRPGCAAAVITDPPYSSGGLTRSDRTGNPRNKYQQHGVKLYRHSFTGDGRDNRGWAYWAALWLGRCLELVKEHGYAITFSDWRQLPTATDTLQAAGWIFRGIVPWNKGAGARAPHTGYFRHQCEFVAWGTRGVSKPAQHGGPWPGCYEYPVKPSDKHHMTGKPTPLLCQLVQCVPKGATILDPFAGSGTTLLAAYLEGRQAIGIEQEAHHCQTTINRLEKARRERRRAS